MSSHSEQSSHERIPASDEPTIPELEVDESIPPRPEEGIADVLRSEPDTRDHSEQPD